MPWLYWRNRCYFHLDISTSKSPDAMQLGAYVNNEKAEAAEVKQPADGLKTNKQKQHWDLAKNSYFQDDSQDWRVGWILTCRD